MCSPIRILPLFYHNRIPVTFIAMLAVACSVSALTTQIKKQEQIRLEAEKEKMRGTF